MNTLTPLARIGSAPVGSALTRRQKAAIIIRLALSHGADVPLQDLPEDLQIDLTRILGGMRPITRDQLNDVVEEFAQELEALGLTFPRGVAGALSVLDGRISAHTAARLRKEAGVRQTGDPWDRIRKLDPKKLVPIIESESLEVAAIILSKLDISTAAELLGLLPGEKARRITYAVSQTTSVTPDALERIGISLAAQLDTVNEGAFDTDPEERVGAILNFSTAATRDDVLTGLEETDKDFADRVRKAIFTFMNIPDRIAPRDIPKVVRGIDQSVLVTAIGGCTTPEATRAADYILENMSGRMADAIREEVKDAGKVKPKDAEAAMTEIVTMVRELETSGELLLIAGEEDED
ncbi:flagellar motor switch protein FliG [Pseudooceanicola nitratireducens]|jgi:flagellar motor switch protein FliG|uniref:Flagellar motor switch protein FliG n=1 Tax=Pseudooceanicola nitratireducens TaxID=517719 RepID=A0A1I1L407_9RHOB|nr:FliG C-terminal domain-containing protein [Pseudooceanicola nitratireducens]SEJ40177.1 flagellar motor switch protein FliG [Pseudooceanicola nitratireducens]SFC67796.1 flagellar motor switch protein FliG [Pseudooceanicola nitratireducens]